MNKEKLKTISQLVFPVILFIALFVLIMDMTSPTKQEQNESSTDDPQITSDSDQTSNDSSVDELIVEDIKEGDGKELQPGDTLVANYTGTLLDGTEFESNEGVEFSLNGVIQGWQEGLPGMKVGGIRKLTIPADMAYGSQSRPEIPANSDLVFEVELVEIVE